MKDSRSKSEMKSITKLADLSIPTEALINKNVSNDHICDICACSFQAGTKVVLSKHTNLTHKKEGDKEEDTFKCGECEYQFSAKWNLNNHIREIHEPKID